VGINVFAALPSVSCSGRFFGLFADVLSGYPSYDAESLERLRSFDPAGRIPMEVAREIALDQVRKTGDVDLGLKVGRTVSLGAAGMLDYAMHTAATVRDAMEVGSRYSRLFSDTIRLQVDVNGRRAVLRVEHRDPVPRVIADFALTAWFVNHAAPALRKVPRVECWFSHERPARLAEYERTFAPYALRFGAPCTGLELDREYLDRPLPAADPGLHAMLCEHAAAMRARLSEPRTFATRVGEIATTELDGGTPTAEAVAMRLRMSTRTLARRLEGEGTTFRAVLDRRRQELALRYVSARPFELGEVAARLGFSHVEAFHRAFKRWTGQTPLAYRRAQQGPVGA
jgi:AraC-like DNA-binding protein